MKTQSVKASDISKEWLIVDAADKTLGRLASDIAYVLRGKHKPSFVRHLDGGDYIVVVNAEKVALTGQKLTDKKYYHHTGYIGGIKGISAQDLLAKHPERVLQKAVRGMLPKTKLSKHILKNLKIYAGTEHPHEAQSPQPMPQRLIT